MGKTKILLIAAALTLCSSAAVFADGSIPSDVQGTAYEAAVTKLMEKQVISGYKDGTFHPEQPLSRAEACTMAVKAKGLEVSTKSSGFSDVDGTWSQNYVATALEYGIVSGYPDGTFHPKDSVTVQELAAMILRAEKTELSSPKWPDSYIEKAKESGLTKGIQVSDWSAAASRGVSAQFISNMISPAIRPGAVSFAMIDGIRLPDDGINGTVSITFGDVKRDLTVSQSAVSSLPDSEEYLNGTLYELKLRNGQIIAIADSSSSNKRSDFFRELTTKSGIFTEVKSINGQTLNAGSETYTTAAAPVVYQAVFDDQGKISGYQEASFSDVKPGTLLRGYDTTGNGKDELDVLVIVGAEHADFMKEIFSGKK